MISTFLRYELKYIIPVTTAHRVMEDVRKRLPPDRYGGEAGYRVISLYFDSPALDAFWNKIEGLKFRRKLRQRIYPGADITQAKRGMVEIKERINRTVKKRRLELPLEEGYALCTGGPIPSGLSDMDRAVALEVSYMARGQSLQPTAITSYIRQAFVGEDVNTGVRITFDTDLRARIHALRVEEEARNRLFVPPDWCIMEVKVNEAVPDWIVSMLARHQCPLRRISKYCAGLAALKGLPTMHLAMAPAGVTAETETDG
jgi:SPX domain protein involved in polyphosphate accumulation